MVQSESPCWMYEQGQLDTTATLFTSCRPVVTRDILLGKTVLGESPCWMYEQEQLDTTATLGTSCRPVVTRDILLDKTWYEVSHRVGCMSKNSKGHHGRGRQKERETEAFHSDRATPFHGRLISGFCRKILRNDRNSSVCLWST